MSQSDTTAADGHRQWLHILQSDTPIPQHEFDYIFRTYTHKSN